jgi:hypothetical protein
MRALVVLNDDFGLHRHAELGSASMVHYRALAPWTLKQVQGDDFGQSYVA